MKAISFFQSKQHWMKAAALLAATQIAACGGGGGGGGGDSDPDPSKTGVFLDAEVEGLAYSASPSGLTGTTNDQGEFDYRDGDTVTFRIGDVVLGAATAQSVVTPRTLAEAATNLPVGVTAADVARNIAIFLQTFDADGNPDNGITIPEAVVSAATGNIVFGKPSSEFIEDSALTALADTVGKTVVTPEDAAAHQQRSLSSLLAGSWIVDDDSAFGVLTLFTDGTYTLGLVHEDENCGNGLEWGRYELDANEGTIQAVLTYADTTGPNGDCGLFEDGEGTVFNLALSENGDALNLTPADSPNETTTLERVPAGSGIAGSWVYVQQHEAGYDKPRAEEPIVITFAERNGERLYFMTHVSTGSDEVLGSEGTARGVEYGTWNVNASNVLSTTQEVDTNGDAGLSDVGNATLTINGNGQLELAPPGEGVFKLSRLPLAKVIDASDLVGTWYAHDPENPDPETSGILTVTFLRDGTFVLGHPVNEEDREENDDRAKLDYAEFDLDTSKIDPWGAGSEYGRWYLETGLGRLYTGEVTVDSTGSSGFYSKTEEVDPRFTHGPADQTAFYVRKVDANTLELTAYNFEDGAPGETNAGVWVVETFQLKRVASEANSLVGAWASYEDGKVTEVSTFFPGGTFHWASAHGSDGGVGRSRWAFNAGTNTLTETMSAEDPYCMDTSEEGIYILPGECEGTESSTYTVAFTNNGRRVTLTEQNEPFEVFELVKITSP
jgi:hypothetical protein